MIRTALRTITVAVGLLALAHCSGGPTHKGNDTRTVTRDEGQGCVSHPQPDASFGQPCNSASECDEQRANAADHGLCNYCRECDGITYDLLQNVVSPGTCVKPYCP